MEGMAIVIVTGPDLKEKRCDYSAKHVILPAKADL